MNKKYQLVVEGRMVEISNGKFTIFEPRHPNFMRVEGRQMEAIWVDDENRLNKRIVTVGVSASLALTISQRHRKNAFLRYAQSHQVNALEDVPMTEMWWSKRATSSKMHATLDESGTSITIHNVDRSDRDTIRFLADFGTLTFWSNSREAHFTPDRKCFVPLDNEDGHRPFQSSESIAQAIVTDLNERVLS